MLPKFNIYYTELEELSKTRLDIEPGRLAKASDIAFFNKSTNKKYKTTLHRCECYDSAYRSIQYICKHRLALLLKYRMRHGYVKQEQKVVKIGYEKRIGVVLFIFGSDVDVLFDDSAEHADLAELVLAP
jgi:hypothetical protein